MRTRRALAAGVVGIGLALAACGTGDEASDGDTKAGPGVDAENQTITIGYIGGLTGPAAALSQPMRAGMETCWKAINADGGVDGWTVKLITEDSGYETQQHVQLFNRIKGDIALLESFGTPTTKAIQPLVEREGIVTVPEGWNSDWGADPLMAPVGTPFAFDTANAIDYATDGGRKKPRIGIVYQDDDAGADFLRGYDAALDAYGFDDVGRLPYKAGDTDLTGQVQRLRSANAEVVVIGGVPTASGAVVGTAASLGYQPDWLFMGPAFIEQLVTEDGTQSGKPTPLARALDGVVVTMFTVPWGDDGAPGMQQMIENQKEFAPDQTPSVYFTVGYTNCKVQEAILRKAIADGDLSREGIARAKLELGEVDLQGLAPDVNYTRELGPPSRESLITEIDPQAPGFLRTIEAGRIGPAAEAIEVKTD